MSHLQVRGAVDAHGNPLDLTIADGLIVDTPSDAPVLDASGLVAVPGFIDIQTNGGWGHDFTNDPASIWEVGQILPRTGVTSFCPTIITTPHDRIVAAQEAMAARPDGYIGAEPLGLHLEGPHLSLARRGTHPALQLVPASKSEITGSNVSIVTVAPEIDGAIDLITKLVMMDIVVSLGHSAADAQAARTAIDAGATLGTHLFNGMPPVSGRDPTITGTLLTDERVRFSVIVDGIHLDPAVVRLIWNAAPDRAILITDATSATGMPEGHYEVGDVSIIVSDGAVRNLDGNLAGSVLTIDVGLANIVDQAGVPLATAVKSVTETPAAALNRPDLGSLDPGNRGDVVLLAGDKVACTVVGGNIAFVQRDGSP
jgi:N-acetylglucosamine-6-phosphate deacetylase